MSRADYIFSIIFHFLLFVTAIVLSTERPRVNLDNFDVIPVSIRSMPIPAPVEKAPEVIPDKKPTIPKAIEAEDQVEQIVDAKTIKDEAKIEPKPKEKPKEEKPYQPEAQKGDQSQAGAGTDSTTDVSQYTVGSKFGTATVDNGNFDYPYWFDLAFQKISRNWTNPVYSSDPIACTIYFQVISSGRIIKIEIEQSSGIASFDRGCKRAVEQSKPLPPLPPQFSEEIIGIHLVFPYSPR